MIFVTVGHQMPFDRLLRMVDGIADECIDEPLVWQTAGGVYTPRRGRVLDFISPDEYERMFNEATAVISHAGTGTIFTALDIGKPLLVVPRLARLMETRNDHQLGTVEHFVSAGCCLAAEDEVGLREQLPRLATFRPTSPASGAPQLASRINAFLSGRARTRAEYEIVVKPGATVVRTSDGR